MALRGRVDSEAMVVDETQQVREKEVSRTPSAHAAGQRQDLHGDERERTSRPQ